MELLHSPYFSLLKKALYKRAGIGLSQTHLQAKWLIILTATPFQESLWHCKPCFHWQVAIIKKNIENKVHIRKGLTLRLPLDFARGQKVILAGYQFSDELGIYVCNTWLCIHSTLITFGRKRPPTWVKDQGSVILRKMQERNINKSQANPKQYQGLHVSFSYNLVLQKQAEDIGVV